MMIYGRTIRELPQTTAVGGESPNWSGEKPQSVCHAAFLSPGVSSYGRPGGGSRKARRCSIGLSTSVSVAHPFESGSAVTNRNWSKAITNQLASVTRLPTSVQSPVIQPKRRGRFPKGVIHIREARYRRYVEEQDREQLRREIEDKAQAMRHLTRCAATMDAELCDLRRRYRDA